VAFGRREISLSRRGANVDNDATTAADDDGGGGDVVDAFASSSLWISPRRQSDFSAAFDSAKGKHRSCACSILKC